MTIELKVPPVGESITEVQIGEWLKSEGDSVQRDEVVVKIETDKVTVDLPAPTNGTISRIVVNQGQAAAVGDVIGYLEEGAAAQPKPEAREAAKPEAPGTASRATVPEQAPKEVTPPLGESRAPAAEAPRPRDLRQTLPQQGFARVMPSARRALKERGLRPEDIEPTGPGGRLMKEDVLRAPSAPRAEAPHAELEEIVPMSPFRRRIAERLVESQHTAAILTTFNEIDMSAVMALRKQHQEQFQERYGIKLGMMSFFVKAAVDALKLIPAVNAEIRGTDIVYKNFYDIGIAV